jgi:hypothetical protein
LGMAGSRLCYGQGVFWEEQIGPNPTDRAKLGVSLLVERQGGPLSIVTAGANVHDTKLLEATAIVVQRPEPTDGKPQHLCLDKANPTGHKAAAAHNYIAVAASERRSWTLWHRRFIQRADG